MLVFNSNTKVQLTVTQTRRYRLSKFGQNEYDFDRDPSGFLAKNYAKAIKQTIQLILLYY